MVVDSEVTAALEDAGAVLEGHFQLNSGRHSDRYLEKFNLLQWPRYTEMVCAKIAEATRGLAPETVAGPTTGGIILAYEVARQLGLRGIFAERAAEGGRAFQRDFRLRAGERVLVVDDVLTSGASVRDTLDAVAATGADCVGVAVLVDRSGGAVRFGELPFFAATEFALQTYEPGDCPLCRDGVPLTVT
ncbi:MAG: orotate phosphoribosyltransferase [Dehalococcoidia bacterium]|nr:orotate phosphoribosyltransferase [Dehalococcoidia bacterium]HRC62091.1 orotate phosphoribosyltransferase [Dehalococcoidia bacterium]